MDLLGSSWFPMKSENAPGSIANSWVCPRVLRNRRTWIRSKKHVMQWIVAQVFHAENHGNLNGTCHGRIIWYLKMWREMDEIWWCIAPLFFTKWQRWGLHAPTRWTGAQRAHQVCHFIWLVMPNDQYFPRGCESINSSLPCKKRCIVCGKCTFYDCYFHNIGSDLVWPKSKVRQENGPWTRTTE